jgi:hypothetical protein
MKPGKTSTDEHGFARIFCFVFVFLFLVSFSSGLTFEGLVRSYSSGYSSGDLKIGGVSDSFDSGNFVFDIFVSKVVEGNYVFYVDLEDEGGVVSGVKEVYLNSPGNVLVEIDSAYLSGRGQFNYSLRVYDSEVELIYRDGNFVTEVYSYEVVFDVLSVVGKECLDDEVVGICFDVLVDSLVLGDESVTLFLQFGNDSIQLGKEVFFVVGSNEVSFFVDGDFVAASHYVGSLEVYGVLIGERFIEVDYVSGIYSYEDFSDGIYLKGYNSSLVDLDFDEKFDYLDLDFYVVEGEADEIFGDVYSGDGVYLFSFDENISGDDFSVRVDGGLVYSLGVDGPYFVRDILLKYKEEEVDFDRRGFETLGFLFRDFDVKGLPDLVVRLDGDEDFVNVSVENVGDGVAFNFMVKLFDSWNYSRDWFVDILDSGELKNFVFDISGLNSDVFFSVVDFDDFVLEDSEDNNFFEVNLSGCEVRLINSSWSEWENVSECRRNGSVLQNRSRVEFDSNFCGEVLNVSYSEIREFECFYFGDSLKDCLGNCKDVFGESFDVCKVEKMGGYSDCLNKMIGCFEECRGGFWGKFDCMRGCVFEEVSCRGNVLDEYKDCSGLVLGNREECRELCFEFW